MKYYGYIRVSTETQVESGYGLDTQENGIKEYAEKNGIEISGFYKDEGISGTDVTRPGLVDLLAAMEENDRVIVLQSSRLWRDDYAKAIVQHELKRIHADVISIEQPDYTIYAKDATSFLVNGMLELLDEYSRLEINMKLAKGRKTKARNGSKACGTAPIGYRWENSNIVPDALEAPIIREIFLAYKHYQSFAKVADFCSERGYKTNQGNEFSRQAIKNILSNDFYISVTRYGGNAYSGSHDAIVSKELFAEVQKIMSEKSRNVERKVA